MLTRFDEWAAGCGRLRVDVRVLLQDDGPHSETSEMQSIRINVLVVTGAMVLALLLGRPGACAQDHVRGSREPVVESIDVAGLAYDYLVDADLPADDPAHRRFKTLQAAYAAAPAGTEERPTVIGIRPNVYHLDGGPVSPSLKVTKDWITFLGLTRNRRSVVLADNRGLLQGASDNGYMLDVDADGFSCRHLTLLNHCNVDYDYPGDPGKNLSKRSDVITQAVALQAVGDKHVYENVAILSRLDTMFLRTTRSYFKNVYIEGTDDWLGGGQVSVWEDCTLVFPEGEGVMIAVNITFFNCRFEAANGMRFYKVGFQSHLRPSALIDCIVPVNTPHKRVAWMREAAPPRPHYYSLTHNVRDREGQPTTIYDSAVGEPTFDYSRALSAEALRAFNPWNLLRAVPGQRPDDWDPAGVRARHEAAGEGALIYRITLNDGSAPADRSASLFGQSREQPSFSVRTGETGATIGAWITPVYADDPTIRWSTGSDRIELDRTEGQTVTVRGRHTGDRAEWVAVHATAMNGLTATAWVYVEPAYTDPPRLSTAPTLSQPVDGEVQLEYELALEGKQDQSRVTWLIGDEAPDVAERVVAVSRGDEPLKRLQLTPGYVGKHLQVRLQPKHQISEPGPVVSVVSERPIEQSDIRTTVISPNFRHFPVTPTAAFVDDLWAVSGNWRVEVAEGMENGYGIHSSGPAQLLYQQDDETGDMQIDLHFRPDKTAGQVFSRPGTPGTPSLTNLSADIFIKYDPRTGNGYSLRFWRTTRAGDKCMFQFHKIEKGVGTPLDDNKVLTGVFKRDTRLTITAIGTTLTATASNTKDDEVLHLVSTYVPNAYGGAGMAWPRGTSALCSRFEIR